MNELGRTLYWIWAKAVTRSVGIFVPFDELSEQDKDIWDSVGMRADAMIRKQVIAEIVSASRSASVAEFAENKLSRSLLDKIHEEAT